MVGNDGDGLAHLTLHGGRRLEHQIHNVSPDRLAALVAERIRLVLVLVRRCAQHARPRSVSAPDRGPQPVGVRRCTHLGPVGLDVVLEGNRRGLLRHVVRGRLHDLDQDEREPCLLLHRLHKLFSCSG